MSESSCCSISSPPFGVVNVLDFGHSNKYAVISNCCFYTQLCNADWDCANILAWPGDSMLGSTSRGQQWETALSAEEEGIFFLPASNSITQIILLHPVAVFLYYFDSWIQHAVNSSSMNRAHFSHLPSCQPSSLQRPFLKDFGAKPTRFGFLRAQRYQPWRAPSSEPWVPALQVSSSSFLRLNNSSIFLSPPAWGVVNFSCSCFFWDTWELSVSFLIPS